jgi:uncharacterized membrane protein
MSDSSQGPGWWQASDGKWYPPESAPAPAPGMAPGGVPASTVDIGAALRYGWNKFVQYIGQLIIILLIIFGVQVVAQILSFAITIGAWLISLVLAAGIVRVALAITNGQEPDPSLLFSTDRLGPYIIASIIVGFLTFLGLFACLVGALVVMVFTYFYPYFVLEHGNDPWQAITNSASLVRANLGGVILFLIVVVLLTLLTCGLATAVTLIAGAYVFKTLNGEPVAA